MDNTNVFLIDADHEYWTLLQKELLPHHIFVQTVEDAETSLESALKTDSDVVIADISNSAAERFDLVKHIKAINETIEVIRIADRADPDVAVGCMKAGAFDFLLKGVVIETRVGRIKGAYKTKSLAQRKNRATCP